ncbi:hypothetical protein OAC41_07280 [Acidimicrobiales bacterium]|nr:hypothetical protein [Acidimicrobiales bacterium]
MANIEVIPDDDWAGALGEIYPTVVDPTYGRVDNIIAVHSLAQLTALDADAPDDNTLIERYKMDADEIAKTPFVLVGSTEQVVDKIERLREQLGISHYVVRDPEGFAPIVEALARR